MRIPWSDRHISRARARSLPALRTSNTARPIRPVTSSLRPQPFGFQIRRIGFQTGRAQTIGGAAFRRQRQTELLLAAPARPPNRAGEGRAAPLARHRAILPLLLVGHHALPHPAFDIMRHRPLSDRDASGSVRVNRLRQGKPYHPVEFFEIVVLAGEQDFRDCKIYAIEQVTTRLGRTP